MTEDKGKPRPFPWAWALEVWSACIAAGIIAGVVVTVLVR